MYGYDYVCVCTGHVSTGASQVLFNFYLISKAFEIELVLSDNVITSIHLLSCLFTGIAVGFEDAKKVQTNSSSIVVTTNRCFDYNLNEYVRVKLVKDRTPLNLGNTCILTYAP